MFHNILSTLDPIDAKPLWAMLYHYETIIFTPRNLSRHGVIYVVHRGGKTNLKKDKKP